MIAEKVVHHRKINLNRILFFLEFFYSVFSAAGVKERAWCKLINSILARKTVGPYRVRNLIWCAAGLTLKNESSLPWVEPCLALSSFLAPFLILSSWNPFVSHMNFTRPSSSGFSHFNSTCEVLTHETQIEHEECFGERFQSNRQKG